MTTNETPHGAQQFQPAKLSLEETARQMDVHPEDLSEWDVTVGDGLAELPFDLLSQPELKSK